MICFCTYAELSRSKPEVWTWLIDFITCTYTGFFWFLFILLCAAFCGELLSDVVCEGIWELEGFSPCRHDMLWCACCARVGRVVAVPVF